MHAQVVAMRFISVSEFEYNLKVKQKYECMKTKLIFSENMGTF